MSAPTTTASPTGLDRLTGVTAPGPTAGYREPGLSGLNTVIVLPAATDEWVRSAICTELNLPADSEAPAFVTTRRPEASAVGLFGRRLLVRKIAKVRADCRQLVMVVETTPDADIKTNASFMRRFLRCAVDSLQDALMQCYGHTVTVSAYTVRDGKLVEITPVNRCTSNWPARYYAGLQRHNLRPGLHL